jgi:hypothetical protein
MVFTFVGFGPALPAALLRLTAEVLSDLDMEAAFEDGTHLG